MINNNITILIKLWLIHYNNSITTSRSRNIRGSPIGRESRFIEERCNTRYTCTSIIVCSDKLSHQSLAVIFLRNIDRYPYIRVLDCREIIWPYLARQLAIVHWANIHVQRMCLVVCANNWVNSRETGPNHQIPKHYEVNDPVIRISIRCPHRYRTQYFRANIQWAPTIILVQQIVNKIIVKLIW